MALIGRFFAVVIGFLAACFVAGMVAVFALLFPEMVDLNSFQIDGGAVNLLVGLGFILVSGFALLPALFLVLITEAFFVRSLLAYAILGALAGMCTYLAFIPFDTVTMTFDGIVRRHIEIMVGAGILGGVVYWLIAGRNAGAWRGSAPPRRPPPPPPPQG